MRLSELLAREVRDRDGQYVGTVADVVFVQDGPMRGPYMASLRLTGLILVERRHVRLMGYERDVLPVLLRWLLTRLAGEVLHVPWSDVGALEGDAILLAVGRDAVERHDPAVRRAGA